jgi:hypothetical protein
MSDQVPVGAYYKNLRRQVTGTLRTYRVFSPFALTDVAWAKLVCHAPGPSHDDAFCRSYQDARNIASTATAIKSRKPGVCGVADQNHKSAGCLCRKWMGYADILHVRHPNWKGLKTDKVRGIAKHLPYY